MRHVRVTTWFSVKAGTREVVPVRLRSERWHFGRRDVMSFSAMAFSIVRRLAEFWYAVDPDLTIDALHAELAELAVQLEHARYAPGESLVHPSLHQVEGKQYEQV